MKVMQMKQNKSVKPFNPRPFVIQTSDGFKAAGGHCRNVDTPTAMNVDKLTCLLEMKT